MVQEPELDKKLTEDLQLHFADKQLLQDNSSDMLVLLAEREDIAEVLKYLKIVLGYTFLTDLTAVHDPHAEKPLCVVYHLHNMRNRHRIRVKVLLEGENPEVASATALWNGANWMERETYDFFGIQFTGHPDLRRILNVDELGVFPMLKQYPLEDPNRVDKKDEYFGR